MDFIYKNNIKFAGFYEYVGYLRYRFAILRNSNVAYRLHKFLDWDMLVPRVSVLAGYIYYHVFCINGLI